LSLNFDDFLGALDDSPFEEDPVDLDTFLHDSNYLDQPKLSQIQRDLVEAMSQIYKEEDLIRIMGDKEGREHYKNIQREKLFYNWERVVVKTTLPPLAVLIWFTNSFA